MSKEQELRARVAELEQRLAALELEVRGPAIPEPVVGETYEGKVVKVVDFGAFVNFLGARDGLVHISELAPHRVKRPSDVVEVGDWVRVKCTGVDQGGTPRLSMKQAA